MNLNNEFTTDPANNWNYVICPLLVDPNKGKTLNKIRKYRTAKIAAIVVKVFLAIATLGISVKLSLIAMDERAIKHEIKIIERIGGASVNRPILLGRVLTDARFLAHNADALENSNEDLLKHQIVTACNIRDRRGNMRFSDEEIFILTKALYQTTRVHLV